MAASAASEGSQLEFTGTTAIASTPLPMSPLDVVPANVACIDAALAVNVAVSNAWNWVELGVNVPNDCPPTVTVIGLVPCWGRCAAWNTSL